MQPVHGKFAILLAFLLILPLQRLAEPPHLEEASLNEPPVLTLFRQASPQSTLPARIETIGTNWIYLPLVERIEASPWINTQDRQASLNYYLNQYLSVDGVSITWTGNHAGCDPGSTSLAFRQAVLRRINYFRAMAGIPANITFSEESNRLAQAAALMMSVNRALDHKPPSSWTCYSDDGARGAGSSDLYLGMYSWDAISGYIRDPGSGNSAVGHRRWILHPPTQVMGTGDIPPVNGYQAANALRVFDDHMWDPLPSMRQAFVAWPPPGYVPYQVIYPRWSFSMDGADFSAASVAMESNGSPVSLSQSTPENGFGDNTLVWKPLGLSDWEGWPFPGTDTAYTVTIQNVKVGGKTLSYSYTVIAFDPQP